MSGGARPGKTAGLAAPLGDAGRVAVLSEDVERLLDQGEFDHVADLLRDAAKDMEEGRPADWLSAPLRRLMVGPLNGFIEANAERANLPRVAAALDLAFQAGQLAWGLEQQGQPDARWFAQAAGGLRLAWLEFMNPGAPARVAVEVRAQVSTEDRRRKSRENRERRLGKSVVFVHRITGELLDAQVVASRFSGGDKAESVYNGLMEDFHREGRPGKKVSKRHLQDLRKSPPRIN